MAQIGVNVGFSIAWWFRLSLMPALIIYLISERAGERYMKWIVRRAVKPHVC